MNNEKYFIYEAINNHFSILEKQLENFKNIKEFDFYNKMIYKQIFHNKKIEIKVILNQYCKDENLKENINYLYNKVLKKFDNDFNFNKKGFIEGNYYLQKNKILDLLKNQVEDFTNNIKKNFLLLYISVLVILIMIFGYRNSKF
jgi:hypothetical protein|tara:strand:- start:409 stop:840 length:432 start_codon:yes stop_codon:yes gene_type:complete